MSEMLQGGGNPWRGMLYGMTNRLPWSGNPAPIWKLWDEFGIADSEMLGYWDTECPVKTDHDDVLATVYRGDGKSLVCLTSCAKEPVECELAVDWQALRLDSVKCSFYAPEIEGLQGEDLSRPTEPLPVDPGSGWMFIVDQTPRKLPQSGDAYADRRPLLEESFEGGELSPKWSTHVSERANTKLSVANGELVIDSTAHTCACIERNLPPGTTLVECQLNSGTDGGQTWGVGLVWPERFVRIHLRTEDKRFGYDDTGKVVFGPHATPGTWQHVRIRVEDDEIVLEGAREGRRKRFRTIGRLPRDRFPGDPVAVRLGKMNAHGNNADFPQPGRPGECRARLLRVFGDG